MLRNASSAGPAVKLDRAGVRRAQTGRSSSSRLPASRAPRAPALLAAALMGAALCGTVAAESLAQPRDNALERRAGDYIRFREDVAAIEATPFDSAKATREAHKRLSAHDSAALSGGWVAYAALVAADSPDFADALKKELSRRNGRDEFLAKLAADPSYPRKMKGADDAIAGILAVAAQDAARFSALGEAFKTQAYAMQKTNWGKSRIAAGSERLSEADGYARARVGGAVPSLQAATSKGVTAPVLASADSAWSPNWGAKSAPSQNAEPNAQVIIDRALNLAARYAIDGVNDKLVGVYAKNDRADQCLSMATLTLRQCIAATRAPYEEAFCLGEHALNDVANCVGWVAGAGAS